MKKIFSFLLIFILVFSLSFATEAPGDNDVAVSKNQSFLDNLTEQNIDNKINDVGSGAANIGRNILDQLAAWSLPFCLLLVVWGSVQYFVLGIRNLYKKRQGLLLAWGSVTLYVIIVTANLILTFVLG